MTPKVIFEDEDILVVDKPAGMVVNKSDTSKGMFTLFDWVEERFKFPFDSAQGRQSSKLRVKSSEFLERAGIVHRLDKETSGLVIIAKNEKTFLNLQKQFKDRQVTKTYIALCHGNVTLSSGEISVPVGRLPWDRKKFGVIPMGRESVTKYKVAQCFVWENEGMKEQLSLVEVYPKTGRTHQIRVHFRYLGNPIFADLLYAGRKNIKKDRKVLDRHFLHAAKITFIHPNSEKRVEFESPLPSELDEFLNKLLPC